MEWLLLISSGSAGRLDGAGTTPRSHQPFSPSPSNRVLGVEAELLRGEAEEAAAVLAHATNLDKITLAEELLRPVRIGLDRRVLQSVQRRALACALKSPPPPPPLADAYAVYALGALGEACLGRHVDPSGRCWLVRRKPRQDYVMLATLHALSYPHLPLPPTHARVVRLGLDTLSAARH